jgi:hypothetical protein
VRSSSSSFNFQHPLVSLRSSSSCLGLLPRLPVTYIVPSIFPSITCFGRQFLRKKWSILLAFLLFIVFKILLSSSTLCNNFSHGRSNWSCPSLSLLHSGIHSTADAVKNKNVRRTDNVVRTEKTRTAYRCWEGETLNDCGDGEDNIRLRWHCPSH